MEGNRGFLRVTKELIADQNWPLIESELKTVFTEVERIEKANGIVEFHGYSPLFQVRPIEGATCEYTAVFSTDNGKPKFLRFEDPMQFLNNNNE